MIMNENENEMDIKAEVNRMAERDKINRSAVSEAEQLAQNSETMKLVNEALAVAEMPGVTQDAIKTMARAFRSHRDAQEALQDAANAIKREAAGEPEVPIRKVITIREFDWFAPTQVEVQLTEWGEDDDKSYTVILLLWSDIFDDKDFPILIETQIENECKICAARSGLDYAMGLSDNVMATVEISDPDAKFIETLDGNELLTHGEDQEYEEPTMVQHPIFLH